jgi:hypothetical protein
MIFIMQNLSMIVTRVFFTNTAATLPEGFEDVKTVQQLYLRREQLLGIKAKLRKNALPSSSPST